MGNILHPEDAFAFYQRFILNEEKHRLLQQYGFAVTGKVPSTDWELFAAILVGDQAALGDGADLERHEVKSAVVGNSFEYQYHRRQGEAKLAADMRIPYHLFISYSRNYRNVTVRRIPGATLGPILANWLPGLQTNYSGDAPRQRYRKSISYRFVAEQGEVLLTITNGTWQR